MAPYASWIRLVFTAHNETNKALQYLVDSAAHPSFCGGPSSFLWLVGSPLDQLTAPPVRMIKPRPAVGVGAQIMVLIRSRQYLLKHVGSFRDCGPHVGISPYKKLDIC
jgi:hypothetical protein